MTLPRIPAATEYQVELHTGPLDGDDERLDTIAEATLAFLSEQAGPAAFAMGPVVSVNLDTRQVELLTTVEAAGQAELHQKVALIVSELQRNVPPLPVESSETRLTPPDGILTHA